MIFLGLFGLINSNCCLILLTGGVLIHVNLLHDVYRLTFVINLSCFFFKLLTQIIIISMFG